MSNRDSVDTADNGSKIPDAGFPVVLRRAALAAAIIGAAGSVGLTLYVGRRNPSIVLMGLFVIWVLSPFAALILAGIISKRWPEPARSAPYWLTLVVASVSLAIYGYVAFGPPRPTPAFAFLAVPFVSWLLTALSLGVTALVSRSRSS